MDPYSSHRGIPALPFCKVSLKSSKPSKIPKNPVSLGEHIKKRRLEQGLFQKDVAKVLGVAETTIWMWENNRSNPQINLLPKIKNFLGNLPLQLPIKTLGDKIVAFRKIHGLSQRELSKLLAIDNSTLRYWERNKHYPSKKLMKKISEFFKKQELSITSSTDVKTTS